MTTKYAFNQYGGNILVGYGTVMDSLYVGAEADIGMNTGDIKTDKAGEAEEKISNRESFGVSGRIGYLLTQKAMVFLSLGAAYEANKYQLTAGDKFVSKVKKGIAPVVGLGTEIAMSEDLSLRVDAKYVMGTEHKFDEAAFTKAGIQTFKERKYKPTRLALRIGLTYRF